MQAFGEILVIHIENQIIITLYMDTNYASESYRRENQIFDLIIFVPFEHYQLNPLATTKLKARWKITGKSFGSILDARIALKTTIHS